MALKKPGELFEGKAPEQKPSINVVENVKEEFNKVSQLRKQLDDVSSSLTEVVDKNLNFLSTEYSDLLEKFNSKINILKEEVNSKVDNLEKSDQYLKTEIQVIEQRQQNINLNRIKKEVISEVQDILSGDVSNNIKRLDEKIDLIRGSYKEVLNEGLLNEPPNTDNADPLTPLDQKFVTLDKFQEHYRLFVNRIQKQLSTLGGGGAVNIRDLDDVDLSTAQVNNKFLKYDSASGKWVGSDTSGGGYTLPVGSGTTLGGVKVGTGLTITTTGILSTTGGDGSIAGINTTGTSYLNQVVSSGVVTATTFVGDGSGLTGVTGSGSGVVVQHDGSNVGTAGTINFSTNLDVSAISAGIVTVTASGGGSGVGTENVRTNTLEVVGLSTHRNGINVAGLSYLDGDVSFVGQNTNALWDKSKSDLVLYDSTRLTLGSNEDFQMWHGGTNTFIKNTGGDLRIRGDVIKLQREDSSETYLKATVNSSVELYHGMGGSAAEKKIETTTTGAIVTGILTANQFKGDGSGLTGVTASGTGVNIRDDGSVIGVAATINFGQNLAVSPVSSGFVTVTATPVNQFTNLEVTGITTLSNLKISSGVITTTSGIVTYYGDVAQIDGGSY